MGDVSVQPALDTADPTFRFRVTFDYQHRYSIPLRVFGQVKTDKGLILGDLLPLSTAENAWRDGILPRSTQNEPMQKRTAVLDCRLSPGAIERLLEAREKNPKKDVELELSVVVASLLPSFRMAQGQPPGPTEGVVMGEQIMWGPGVGEFRGEVVNARVTIFSSQWTTDYAPAFGIGRFLIVELPQFAPASAGGQPFAERLGAAFQATKEMERDIQAGEWISCVENSRAVAELLKLPDEIKAVFLSDGLTEAAAEDLLKSIRGAFDFASKFLKKVERGTGGVNPSLVAKKEDAYFVFSNSLTLVNLLSRKLARGVAMPALGTP